MENIEIAKEDVQLTDSQIKYQYTRKLLIEQSNNARLYRDKKIKEANSLEDALKWAGMKINDILKMFHSEKTGATEYNTFNQWSNEGYSVKRGEKAFVLWGKKRKASSEISTNTDSSEDEPQEKDYEFFPIAYLFTDLQVAKRKEKEKEEKINTYSEKEKEEEKAEVILID